MPFPYYYITTPAQRDEAVKNLLHANVIGVDTEGDSLYHYNEQVALIQISGNNRHYIFDPLLLDSVKELAPLFETRSILKVFHGAEYDITSLKRDFGFKIGPVFDTALAARAIGMTRFSLKELVSRFCDVTLCKEQQKSNWSLRPLSEDQLNYACEDTVHLSTLYALLSEEVKKKGRWDQMEEECRLMEELTWMRKPFDPADYIRVKGARNLSVESQRILRELVIARDGLAREKDLPPFKVARSHELIRLALNRPQTKQAFTKLFSKGQLEKDMPVWLAAIQQGIVSKEPLSGRLKKSGIPMTNSQQKLFVQLRRWRDQQAQLENVEAAMVLTTPLLQAIAKKKPLTIDALRAISLRQWQINHYGEQLLQAVKTPRILSEGQSEGNSVRPEETPHE